VNVEEHYRTTLDRLTQEPPAGPDLAAVLAGGRRRRRVRRTAWAGAGVSVAAVAAVAGVVLGHQGRATTTGPTGGASYHDFVPGTDLDESLQATAARHLPTLPAATAVYPSDWNTPGPIPDGRFADATEWHAVYDVSPTERLTVLTSRRIPGQPAAPRCQDVQQVDLPCTRTEGPDGSLDMRFGTVVMDTTYRFITLHVTADGFVAETLDDVRAGSWPQAVAARELTDAGTAALVADPDLRFPAPLHTPPSPPPQA